MTMQASLFDSRPAEAGMATASSHADPHDLASVRLHAETLAKAGSPFTAEDVRARLSDAQNARLDAFPASLGGTFYMLQKQGIIVGVGYVRATRSEARGRPVRLWMGVKP